jgi:hypothetical protein
MTDRSIGKWAVRPICISEKSRVPCTWAAPSEKRRPRTFSRPRALGLVLVPRTNRSNLDDEVGIRAEAPPVPCRECRYVRAARE